MDKRTINKNQKEFAEALVDMANKFTEKEKLTSVGTANVILATGMDMVVSHIVCEEHALDVADRVKSYIMDSYTNGNSKIVVENVDGSPLDDFFNKVKEDMYGN